MSDAIAGVVVLYHPDETVEDNIRSYLPYLRLLVVVDNSPSISTSLKTFLEGSEKIRYFGGGVNRGIATALNLGADKAIERGCSWLLTMDQDSRFEPGALERLIKGAENSIGAGIISPLHVLAGRDPLGRARKKDASYVMTSGNLMNLTAFRVVGPFLEKLFIDYVDCEYCLRLRKSGYSITIVEESKLLHTYGEIQPRRLLGLVFYPTHHSPERKYYITRNRLYVLKKYPAFIAEDFKPWVVEFLKFLLFEKRRLLKLRFMAKGALDFLRNRYGPLNS